MPLSTTVNLPPTKDAYEFKYMVADVASIITGYNSSTFGRRGQKQDGIDGLSSELRLLEITQNTMVEYIPFLPLQKNYLLA